MAKNDFTRPYCESHFGERKMSLHFPQGPRGSSREEEFR